MHIGDDGCGPDVGYGGDDFGEEGFVGGLLVLLKHLGQRQIDR